MNLIGPSLGKYAPYQELCSTRQFRVYVTPSKTDEWGAVVGIEKRDICRFPHVNQCPVKWRFLSKSALAGLEPQCSELRGMRVLDRYLEFLRSIGAKPLKLEGDEFIELD